MRLTLSKTIAAVITTIICAPSLASAAEAYATLSVRSVVERFAEAPTASRNDSMTANPTVVSWIDFNAFSFPHRQPTFAESIDQRVIEPMAQFAYDAGDWIASRSTMIADAAHGANVWIADTWVVTVTSARDTGAWIASKSTSLADNTVTAAGNTLGSITILQDLHDALVAEVKNHFHKDSTSEFAELIKDSGFALSDIKVGVGLIPALTLEFEQERDLTPEELLAFEQKIAAYSKNVGGPVGFFQEILLRNLVKAGHYSDEIRISEVHVDVFPLPGLELYFDPFNYNEDKVRLLEKTNELSELEAKQIKAIEARISEIESRISASSN